MPGYAWQPQGQRPHDVFKGVHCEARAVAAGVTLKQMCENRPRLGVGKGSAG